MQQLYSYAVSRQPATGVATNRSQPTDRGPSVAVSRLSDKLTLGYRVFTQRQLTVLRGLAVWLVGDTSKAGTHFLSLLPTTSTRRALPHPAVAGWRLALPLFMAFCAQFITEQAQAQTAPTCTSKEYIYLNEPNANAILKFEVGSPLLLTEKTGVNGSPHWYPGTGVSEVELPHGLATDLNGNLYIGGLTGATFQQRKFSCDGALSPIGPNTLKATANNTFSIGNILFTNWKTIDGVPTNGAPSAYNTCTAQYLGSLCLNGAIYENGADGDNTWGFSYNPTTHLVYITRRYDRRVETSNPDAVPKVWVLTKAQLEAGIAGNGGCFNPLITMGSSVDLNPGDKVLPNVPSGQVMGITSDNAGNFYVVVGFGSTTTSYIYKYDSSGGFVARTPAGDATSPFRFAMEVGVQLLPHTIPSQPIKAS